MICQDTLIFSCGILQCTILGIRVTSLNYLDRDLSSVLISRVTLSNLFTHVYTQFSHL